MENHLSQQIQLMEAIPQQIIVADTEIQLMVAIPQCTGIQLTHLLVAIVTQVMDINHLAMVTDTDPILGQVMGVIILMLMEKLEMPDMELLKLPNPKNKMVLILMAHMVHIFLHLPMVHMDTQVTDTHLIIHLPIVNMTKKATDTHLLIHQLLHLPIITDTHLLHIVTDMAMVVIVSHIHIMADMVNME